MIGFKFEKEFIVCAFVFSIHTGLNSIATAAIPSLKAFYSSDLTSIVLGASVCCVSAFIATFFSSKIIQILKPKKTLLLGSINGFLFCFIIASSKTLKMFYIGCIFAGLLIAWGTYAPIQIYIRNLYSHKQGVYTSYISAIGLLASALFQVLTGKLLINGSISYCYLIMSTFSIIAFLINFFFLKDINFEIQKKEKREKKSILFKDVSFLLLLPVVLIISPVLTIFANLLTTLLANKGFNSSESSMFLSIYTIMGGLLAMHSGRLFDRVTTKRYILNLAFVYLIGLTLSATWYFTNSIILLFASMICFAYSVPLASLYNLIVGRMFKNDALFAHTKLMSMTYLGSTLILPMLSKLYQEIGYTKLLMVLSVLFLICIVLLMVSISLSKQEEKVI